MHIHIDPVGGIAGDMFLAAMVDLFPDLEERLIHTLKSFSLTESVNLNFESKADELLVGKKLAIVGSKSSDHCHIKYVDLKQEIQNSGIQNTIIAKSCEILETLAKAESVVHGVSIDQVELHETGAVDSLVDIVGAAVLITSLDKDITWTCSPLPIGSGTVNTLHGEMPVPVPAVVELLHNYPVFKDGRMGERVTPTGAAILKTLAPSFDDEWRGVTLVRAGNGCGTHRFEGMSNILRLLLLENSACDHQNETVGVVEFEIDDQTAEDLSIGLDNIRRIAGVLDVLQVPAIGKKGRMVVHIQVLCMAEHLHETIEACLSETSTLGVRHQIVERVALSRKSTSLVDDHSVVSLKTARRPGNMRTAKIEADNLAKVGNYGQRKRLKQDLETIVEKSGLK